MITSCLSTNIPHEVDTIINPIGGILKQKLVAVDNIIVTDNIIVMEWRFETTSLKINEQSLSARLREGNHLQNHRSYSDKEQYQRDYDNNEEKNHSKV